MGLSLFQAGLILSEVELRVFFCRSEALLVQLSNAPWSCCTICSLRQKSITTEGIRGGVPASCCPDSCGPRPQGGTLCLAFVVRARRDSANV